ncbi:NUDIX domain-containing protein [Alcanivorax sp.]|uniref:NUDIX domain-containing protein n=1 Tax=Alcanivorax sp. TaxID=1872427 RepID=UPI00258B481B|nr:NUDIX domain-containing protein [Alcanivorax sp.]
MEFRALEEKTVWRGFLHLKRYRLEHQCFSGGWCPPVVRERVEGNHAVSVLLYDPAADQVVLIEQFRVGAMGHLPSPWLLETVGGYCELGETPEAVARRESMEEAGCEPYELISIGTLFSSPGWSSERLTFYCGLVESEGVGGIHGLAEEGEDIRVVVMPAEAAIGELFQRANSTSIVVTLQWLAANRKRLRRQGSATSNPVQWRP